MTWVTWALVYPEFDPIAFSIGPFAVRWYALAYILGLTLGWQYCRVLCKRPPALLTPEAFDDFLLWATIGVVLGGRFGYILFYKPDFYLDNPAEILKIWRGGMSFHGGMLGVFVAIGLFARRRGVSYFAVADIIAAAAPIGLFLGRIANFINGELYGRVANGVAWAVKFPETFINPKLPESTRFDEAMQAAIDADDGLLESINGLPADMNEQYFFHKLVEANRESDAVTDAISPYLEPRHPSQIYEGLLEGAVLFAILWIVRVKFPKAPNGLLTGLFFGLYATFRIIAEQYREPDAAWVIEGLLTQGQFLSLFMYLFSAAFLIFAFRSGSKTAA